MLAGYPGRSDMDDGYKAAPAPFGIYVLWHPEYSNGKNIAVRLHSHFATDLNRNVAGGAKIPILYRNTNASGTDTPLPVDWDIAADTAVVILLDDMLARDASWTRYIQNLMYNATPLGSRVFPVVTENRGLDVCQDVQALRWDEWTGDDHERGQELIRRLTHDFIRMLRYRLEAGRPDLAGHPDGRGRRVNVFISHSTNDVYGKQVAEAIRDWVSNSSQMSSFLASRDIPTGVRFGDVIDNSIRDSVVVVVYTDSYSSSEWCRHEVIEAKRANAPMLMVDCLESIDERSFSYMGNMPMVRMDPASVDDIPVVVGRMLDEAFRHVLWRCGVDSHASSPHTAFMAWPPELVSVAVLPSADGGERSIVYPDPPLSPEELGLFSGVDRNLRLLSLSQWRMEAQS